MKKLSAIFLFLLLGIVLVNAQKKNIQGFIFDEVGEPVIGATILIKGTNEGTITNIDGQFILSARIGSTLVISYIGYATQEVTAEDNLKIVMLNESQKIKEVVVTGMSKMDKRLFTGATDKIDIEKERINGISDISRSLEGRSAGVSVQNVSGTFGTAPKIRVRGATSIYGSSKPLWVVDGVIVEDSRTVNADELSSGNAETLISSAIAGLNADDIESFQILKDGSATSIYGARAMAGVIVITTKKGRAGVNKLSYTGEFTTRLIPSYKNFNIFNSQEQMSVYKEMRSKGWLNFSEVLNMSDYGVYGKMYELMNTYNTESGQFALSSTPESENFYLRNAEMRNTNWFNELFDYSLLQNHSVSISGGSEKANYYASLSAMVDPGWYKQSEVNRYTANINVNYYLTNDLSINLISTSSYRKQKAPGTLSQDVDIVHGRVLRNYDINPYSYALNSSRALDTDESYVANFAPFNIKKELDNNYMDLNVVDTKFQAELKYRLAGAVDLSILGALKYSSASQEHKIKDDSNQAESYRAMETTTIRDNNKLLYSDPDNPYSLPVSILPSGGIYKRTDNNMIGYDFRASANWNHTFNGGNIVNLFGGMETNSNERNRTWFNGWGMQYSKGEIPFYVYQFFKKDVEDNNNYYSISGNREYSMAYFGNGTYSYKGCYILNGTIRYEGTNKLGKSRSARWLPTWNVSAGWNIHEESFFENIRSIIPHLLLKASYSLTADRGPADVINSTAIFNSYNPYRPFSYDKESALKKEQNENCNLTYEKKHEKNIGIEIGFLNNRINVSADVYQRDNFDLIGPVNTQGIGGIITEFANMASMKSEGCEVSLSTLNIKTKNFKWQTSYIFSHNKNKITSLKTNTSVIDLVSGVGFAKEGYPVRALFSIPFEGLDENGYPLFKNEKGETTSWDIDFQNRDDNSYLKYEGSTDPTINGSFGNTFTYKGFNLNLFITYSGGNKVRLDPVFSAKYSDLTSMTKDFKNRWMVPGDENKTNVPVIISKREYSQNSYLQTGYNAYNYSNVRIAKGDFIRMKEISVSYDFPSKWYDGTTINNLSLKLQATNLFLLYADKKLNGQDPEFCNAGGVASPMPKQFTLTLKFGI